MRLILNVIWLIFGGLWLALGYFLAGLICFVLIITIPFGVAAFRKALTGAALNAAVANTSAGTVARRDPSGRRMPRRICGPIVRRSRFTARIRTS